MAPLPCKSRQVFACSCEVKLQIGKDQSQSINDHLPTDYAFKPARVTQFPSYLDILRK